MLSLYSLVKNPIFERHYAIDLSCPSHFHTQVEIAFVLDGEIEVEVLGKKKTLGVNEIAIIFPNTLHRYETIHHAIVLVLIFTPTFSHGFFDMFQTQYPTSPFLSTTEIHPDLLYVMKAISGWSDFFPCPETIDLELIRIYMSLTIYRIAEKLSLKKLHVEDTDLPIHKCLTYLLHHFHEPLTLEHVAKDLGYSKYFISRIFSNKIGCSFNIYLNTLRVEYAQNLLKNTTKSLDEIWYQSGFSSQSTFYRCFKEITKCAPKHYRIDMTD